MSDEEPEYNANPRYVEAMIAILMPLMVPAEGFDEEARAACDTIIDMRILGGLEEQEGASMLARYFKAHRAGKTIEAELDAHAKALPEYLRETLFAKFSLYLAGVSDGDFSESQLDRLNAIAEFLEISSDQANKIRQVTQISCARIR